IEMFEVNLADLMVPCQDLFELNPSLDVLRASVLDITRKYLRPAVVGVLTARLDHLAIEAHMKCAPTEAVERREVLEWWRDVLRTLLWFKGTGVVRMGRGV